MRILFVLSSGEPGGAELAMVSALSHLPVEMEGRVVLLSPGPIQDELAALGMPASVGPSVRRSLVGRGRLARMVDRELGAFRPHLIHAVGNKAALVSLLPARRRGLPLAWQKVDFSYDGRRARLLARECRMVVGPSHAAVVSVPEERRRVIYPGVRLGADLRLPPARPAAVVGSVGRLEPRKGHQHMIEAVGRLRNEFPDIGVVIAGAPPAYASGYADHLRRVAETAGIGDRLQLLGHVDRVEDALARMTVFVSASYRDRRGRGGEGLGLALAEASWSGLPVVATDSGGASEVVLDGITGGLVPPGDPGSLADAIARFLRDPGAAATTGEAGARFARQRFDPAKSAERLFTHLAQCLEAE
jgi:glycosyltransferase involved in cell wall biosynthesis